MQSIHPPKNGSRLAIRRLNPSVIRLKWKSVIFGCLIAIALLSGGCSSEKTTPRSSDESAITLSKPEVAVVNYPLAWFASVIGGDAIRVVYPVPTDIDPADWNPDSADIARFQAARLILLNGADYAPWIARATLPTSRCVTTTQNITDQLLETSDVVAHKHGPEGEHTHGVLATHTWLDPQLAIAQAIVVRDALCRLLPENASDITKRFEQLEQDLSEIDRELESAFAASADKLWLASHPVYQYLQRRYQLDLRSFHWEPHEVPDSEQWDQLEKLLTMHPATMMLWEDTPSTATEERLVAMGIRPVVFRTCSNQPAAGDYMDTMRKNVQSIKDISQP